MFNCSARIEKEGEKLETKGNCTEVGLLNFLMNAGVDAFNEIKLKDDNILEVIPFNSKRKRACCALRYPND